MIPDESVQGDTISVRADEKFGEKKLAEYLKDKLEGGNAPLTVRQFWGGAANLTYLLEFAGKEYVLRRPPLGPVAKSSHDMGREYRVLSVLHKAYPYAPRAFLYCDDPAVIGSPFFVMERKKGFVIRRSFPSGYDHSIEFGQRISEAMVDRLADLHTVDYEALGLGEFGHPEGFIHRQIEGWYRRWNKAKTEEVSEMDTIYQWLNDNTPETSRFSLVHNDYKLDNLMLNQKDPRKIEAIFDWDMCTLGDPLSDLGSLLTYWSDPTDPPYLQVLATMPTGKDLGFLTRAQLVNRYTEKSGFSVDNITFYHTLGLFRLSVIIAQIYIRFVKGQTKDQRFESLGTIVPYVAKAAEDVAYGRIVQE
jgi:aminoglycoside phosphotransferase (APT) family kinase protein